MYLWGNFPKQQYEALLHEGVNPEAQVQVLQAHAEKARATGTALPPGFRAHLGMLQLAIGNVDGAREAWTAEKLAFPESAPYVDRLLRQLEAPATTLNTGNPA